jgi:membrane peptidoglycan carboxypeptidase
MYQDPGFQSRVISDARRKSPLRREKASGKGMLRTILRFPVLLWRMLCRIRERYGLRRLLLICTAGFVGAVFLFLVFLWFTLPNINDPEALFATQSTVILDRNGTELYRLFSEQDRTYVRGAEISPFIKNATVAIEDERFFNRGTCFDVIGFARAALSQIAPRFFIRSGGSTLTQQFAGNALVGRQRSILRKLRELMLSCQLERRFTKDQLLELYLNWIPYGYNAYGVEQASKNYFGIHAKDVSLAQATVLAALPQRPTYFSPYGKHLNTSLTSAIEHKVLSGAITRREDIPDSAIVIGLIGRRYGSGASSIYIGGRTDQVLSNMLKQGKITAVEEEQALRDLQTIVIAPERQDIRAAHFVLGIQKQVQDDLGIDEHILEQGGFRITTTIDWNLQQIAEKTMLSHKDDLVKRFGAHNAALVALSPVTREILAYVGNIDYSDEEHEGKIDMARSPRQPGSSFKAFTYLAAFEQGYGPGSPVYDVPTKFGEDQPQNFDGTFWGLVSMRRALAGSRNIPAIKAFFLGGGEQALLDVAARVGVTTPKDAKTALRKDNPDFDYGWPLAIGAAETPLIEMVQGYATIADGGVFLPTVSILKITDKDGNIRYMKQETPPQQMVDQRITAQVTSILSDASARPANEYWKNILSVPGFAAAAKTGTSNKCLERDTKKNCTLRRPESTWTIGYTPSIAVGVWVGNATSQSLFEKADGLTTAAPIWHDFMVGAMRKMKDPATSFPEPARMSHPLISRLSGQLASACTPVDMRTTDLFLEEKTPITEDPACILVTVDKVTGLLSSPACPPDATEQRAFFVPKSELPDRWPLWEQGVQEWAAKQMAVWSATPDHSGSLLPLPLAPTKECDPTLTPGRDSKPEVELLSPSAGSMVPYPIFAPEVRVSSKSPITQVQYSIDGKVAGTFTTEPYQGPIRTPRSLDKDGTHTLTVTVTDTYFNTATATASFRFGTDASAPTVQWLEPKEGAMFFSGDTVTLKASAEDSAGIELVQFFLDDTLLTSKREPPFTASFPLKTTVGPHTLRVTAKDNAGNQSEASIKITVPVK